MDYIKILSWNILGAQAPDLTSFETRYPDVKNWSKRYTLLLEKIISFDADIMCLQEIDIDIKQDFEYALTKHGYNIGSYEAKNNGGVLVAYKTEKFNCINSNSVQLKIDDNSGLCAWATLMHKKNMQKLVVCSLHLYWQQYKKQLEIFAQALQNQIQIPVILAGDFNITYPTMMQEVTAYMQQLNIAKEKLLLFEHSSWTTQPAHNQDPTSFESLDHILFSSTLQLNTTLSYVANAQSNYKDERVSTMDRTNDLTKKSIPSDIFPSDHLPIITSFKLNGY